MKILSICFENIHSLQGIHQIDFDKDVLADAGLFAITGPTGSGKSTLLDVITLALYNKIARISATKEISNTTLEEEGSIMTRNSKSCFAEVTFKVNNTIYRSHWSIERNRNGHLKNRKQELIEVGSKNIIAEGTKVPEHNTEIIGLGYDQFVKAILLAQGEFSKLLKAPRDERNKLLENITGVKVYREIGKAVFFRFKQIENNIGSVKDKTSVISILPEEKLKLYEQRLIDLNHQKPELDKRLSEAEEKKNVRERLISCRKEITLINDQKNQFENKWQAFKNDKQKLEKHIHFVQYAGDINKLTLATKAYNLSLEKLNDLQTKIEKATQNLSEFYTATSNFIGIEVDTDKALQQISEFRDKVELLLNEGKTQRQLANHYKEQVKKNTLVINAKGYSLQFTDKYYELLESLKLLIQALDKKLLPFKDGTIDDISNRLSALEQNKEAALECINKKELQNNLLTNINKGIQDAEIALQKIEHNNAQLSQLKKEAPELENEIAQLELELEKQKLTQSLEQHRSQLIDEEPCPLCGSLSHPYAEHLPVYQVSSTTLSEKKKLLQTKNERIATLAQHNTSLNENITTLNKTKELNQQELSKINVEINTLSSNLSWPKDASVEDFKDLKSSMQNEIELLQTYLADFDVQDKLIELNICANDWIEAEEKVSSLVNQYQQLYKGKDIKQDSDTLIRNITTSITERNNVEEQIASEKLTNKSNLLELEKCSNIIDAILAKEKVNDLQKLQSYILNENDAEMIRKREQELLLEKNSLSNRLEISQKQLNELLPLDNQELDDEAVKMNYTQAKNTLTEVSKEIGSVAAIINSDIHQKNIYQQYIDELSKLNKDRTVWKTMNDLIGDAVGNKFSNFVQDLTLEQLIVFANKRLTAFTDRYLLAKPDVQNEKSDNLKVIDMYMGNAQRSVITLSGGETFIVSLAMALALSDIAARNVKIDSLFIDEGFGTLDPDTLDNAISVLEKMQDSTGKSIGIISHVEALKERITTQIQLSKNNLGFSTIHVVG